MYYDKKLKCDFTIYTPIDGWGFHITVRPRKHPRWRGTRQEYRYHVGQQVGHTLGSVNGSSSEDVYYCTWELSDHHYDVLLSGNLTSRTDPFAPLMKCLAFLEAKHGGKE